MPAPIGYAINITKLLPIDAVSLRHCVVIFRNRCEISRYRIGVYQLESQKRMVI
jgi:hypothetical protein